jgi:hypothetical protein
MPSCDLWGRSWMAKTWRRLPAKTRLRRVDEQAICVYQIEFGDKYWVRFGHSCLHTSRCVLFPFEDVTAGPKIGAWTGNFYIIASQTIYTGRSCLFSFETSKSHKVLGLSMQRWNPCSGQLRLAILFPFTITQLREVYHSKYLLSTLLKNGRG